jgi:hypothetical protein
VKYGMHPNDGPVLFVVFTNRSQESIEIIRDFLPWSPSIFGMWVHVAQAHAPYSTLKPLYLVAHMEGIEALRPGQSMAGTIRLKYRFPEFQTALKKTDLIAHWHWECLIMDRRTPDTPVSQGTLAGWVIIPKDE